MQKLLETVSRTVRIYDMFRHGDAVLAGVSGGADSVALLHVLIAVSPEFSLRIGIAHLNHCLRGEESDRDAEFVCSLAKQLNLPYYIESADVRAYSRGNRLSEEEAGRELRYEFYERIAGQYGYDRIALGHHADDNAELVLMYLLRGSGTSGLSGIPPVRGRHIVRPLIGVSRSEIGDFLTANRLAYVSDASNADTKFLRNRIRHELIPLLISSYNPKIVESLNRLSSILRSEDEWMDDNIRLLSDSCISDTADGKTVLSVPDTLCLAAQRRIIRKAIAGIKGNLRRISYSHIEALSELLRNGPENGSLDLPDGIRGERIGNKLVFSKTGGRNLPAVRPVFEYIMKEPGTVFIKEIAARVSVSESDMNLGDRGNPCVAFFDRNAVSFPVTVRNFRPGDRFMPLGAGGTQKVKKYFINKKIPGEERRICPILVSGGKIIWIAGHRTDESVKVTAETETVLKAELFLA